ncbi:hypothetical protein Tco_0829879 [Tanacetum coccineum]
MDNLGTTMEEYVQFETEKFLRHGQVYNKETAKYDMELPPRNERHEWLRFDAQGYTEEELMDEGMVEAASEAIEIGFEAPQDVYQEGGSELGNELTLLAGSELKTSELDTSKLKTSEYRGKESGVNILKSINEGPFHMGTFRETLAEGNEGALHLGLPKDIYSLINHYTDAKDIWDNVKMLLEGSELTKEDHGSQLFVTAVKLNRGLRDSNYDQLYAYLKQHEAHANENKMMLERFTQPNVDPLALMSNVSHQQYNSQSSTNPSSTYVPPHFADNSQLDLGLSPTDNLIENLTNTLALLTQSYKTYLPQTNNQLRTSSNPRNQATVQDGRVVVQNVQGRQNRGQGNHARGTGATGYGGAQSRVGNAIPGQARQIKCYNCNENVVDEDVDEQLVQDLALNMDNVFQAKDCDAFDSNVDEDPTTQTMFIANLSSADLVYDEAGPSYDSNIISEYVKDNAVPDVQSNVSYVPNDAYMMILNDIYEPSAQCVFVTTQNNVVDNSLTAELATYKEQVELYERWAKFELTEREQKINEQLRIVIADRNRKEENLKRELHSVKLQLTSTINHNKSMVEEVTSLKKDFKQKENKYLEEFLDMKALKERVEDKLYKQDQSLQTVHMLCKPKPYYDEKNKALTNEIKETKGIFEELEAEVDQNVVHRKNAEIERKTFLLKTII